MKTIINIILLIIAIVLMTTIGLISFIYSVIDLFFSVSRGRFYEISKYFKEIAVEIDIFGNFICKRLFNLLLLTPKSRYKFGVNQETCSSVFGKNQKFNTLTKLGIIIANILDTIEPHHCKKSIKYFI